MLALLHPVWQHRYPALTSLLLPLRFLISRRLVISTNRQAGDLLQVAYKHPPLECISSPRNRNQSTKMSPVNRDLDSLFPAPSPSPSKLSPTVWPGNSQESTTVLQKCLKENHEKFHIFFNDQGFHNHTSHHLLAIWALGASGPVIEAAYKVNTDYQRLAEDSPGPITLDNLYDHLGDPQ